MRIFSFPFLTRRYGCLKLALNSPVLLFELYTPMRKFANTLLEMATLYSSFLLIRSDAVITLLRCNEEKIDGNVEGAPLNLWK